MKFKSCLAFEPVSNSFPQAFFRTENVELIHAAVFRTTGFPIMIFPQKEMVLSDIKPFLKA